MRGNKITVLKSNEEEEAYLLHLKDLQGTHERRRETGDEDEGEMKRGK